ncbi:MAG TPA: DUF503 domain-containing protein [Deltaproteobacteria bacterium]|nr:DUF503 domain-containing protein [Deltaproteobacteria bacterium]
MVVAILRLRLIIHGSRSLKGKRQVVKAVTARVRNRFNVSVAEVGDHDLWQSAVIGVAAVGVDRAVVNSLADRIVDFVETAGGAELADHRMEIVNC